MKLADKVRIPQRAVLPIIRYFSCNFLRDCGMIFQMSLFLPGGVFNMIWKKANLLLLPIQARGYWAMHIYVHMSMFFETQIVCFLKCARTSTTQRKADFLTRMTKLPSLIKAPPAMISKKKTKGSFAMGQGLSGVRKWHSFPLSYNLTEINPA